MQEIAAKLEEVLVRLDSLEERLQSIDDKVCKLVMQGVSKKGKNALRRQYYRERRAEAFKDRLKLPEFGIFQRRDRRLQKEDAWAAMGLRFGKADRPAAFISWLVWVWNNEVYVKKPITFSGSAFRVWNGSCRHALGPGDLMHYYRKRVKMVPFLRNEAERQDFSTRPWWEWGNYVLLPVIREMKESEQWETFSDRFKTMVQLLGGGFCEMEVAGTNWDFNEEMPKINNMMKKLAPVWIRLIEACLCGLRAQDCPPVPALPPSEGSRSPRRASPVGGCPGASPHPGSRVRASSAGEAGGSRVVSAADSRPASRSPRK